MNNRVPTSRLFPAGSKCTVKGQITSRRIQKKLPPPTYVSKYDAERYKIDIIRKQPKNLNINDYEDRDVIKQFFRTKNIKKGLTVIFNECNLEEMKAKKSAFARMTKEMDSVKDENIIYKEQVHPIFLQFKLFNAIQTDSFLLPIKLMHSIQPTKPKVCLFVPELDDQINPVSTTDSMQYFDNTLEVTNTKQYIDEVIPFQTLCEGDIWELRNSLFQKFDIFLGDKLILPRALKLFKIKKSLIPVPVILDSKKQISTSIVSGLEKVNFVFFAKGRTTRIQASEICNTTIPLIDNTIFQIGHNLMTPTELMDNIWEILSTVVKNEKLIGGMKNISRMNLVRKFPFKHRIFGKKKTPKNKKIVPENSDLTGDPTSLPHKKRKLQRQTDQSENKEDKNETPTAV